MKHLETLGFEVFPETIKGQGPGPVNVPWAGTTMPEHVSYRDVKNKYTVGYEIGQRADPHAIADRKPQAVTKLHTEPSRAASATLHLCVTRAHIAHGRAAA